ncbi:MAG: sugar ABC transporter permease [Anaerolineae bacterium]|nr:sugar ABC transporter permease [Anaerolineae bacterium]
MLDQLNRSAFRLPSLRTFRSLSPLSRREMRVGLIFLTPWIIGFLAFTLLPIIASLVFSFMDMRITDGILNAPQFVGLDNYQRLFSDPQIWTWSSGTRGSLWITLRFGLFALPVGILAPLGLAILLNNPNLKGTMAFRSLFYMPYIIPFVAAIFLWGGMLNPESGWINRALVSLGIPKESTPNWANDINWVYPTYVIMGIWGIGNAMLIMLSGLQSVPTELYDAAKVDGANSWQSFRNVTFPMISPVIFYNVTLSMVGLFQYFLVPLVVNNGTGRPGGATMFYNLYLYRTFFTFQNMSYGSAMAWLLFVLILIVTLFLFGTARYWVYYAGESRS